MTKEEMLLAAKPILFNTAMVQAVLGGRKTVTRRAVKYKYSNTEMRLRTDMYGTRLIEIQKDVEGETFGRNPDGGTWSKLLPYIDKKPRYKKGDILYIRETWNYVYDMDDNDKIIEGTGRYAYYADDPMPFTDWVDPDTGEHKEKMPWRPSIHMPKAAARIFLRVEDVRAERMHGMGLDSFRDEGVSIPPEAYNDPENAYMQAREIFRGLWDSTLKKEDLGVYGWDADPWVWAIRFRRMGDVR